MIIQKYNLNMIPDKVPVMVRVSQYDQFSRTIIFSLYDGAIEYEIPSGSTISVRGTKPDHTGFEYPCTFEGNEVSFDIEPQQTVLSGLVPSEIRITSNNEIVGSCNFIINVEPTPLDESTVISDTELPLIEEASQAAVIAQGAAAAAEASAEQAEQVLSTAVKSVNNTLPDAQGNVDVVALPDSGTAGQILTKQSSADGDADWENPLINYEETGSVPSATPLNADQLQGHPASYFQQLLSAGTGIDITGNVISNKYVSLSSPNLNNINYNYMGYVTTATNIPSGVSTSGQFVCVVREEDNNYLKQFFMPYNTNDVYMRNNNGGTWSAWQKISNTPTLLWTNSSPTSKFASQTAFIDTSKYSLLYVKYRPLNTATLIVGAFYHLDGARTFCIGLWSGVIIYRIATASNGRIDFEDGNRVPTYAGAATVDNAYMVPIEIYGL